MENSVAVSKNRATMWSAVPLLGIYTKKIKLEYQKNVCTPMFAAAVFTIAKIWKQPKCPSEDEWIF
jgi:hypothetical protein